ncbi:hypothetical protein JL720_8985 [Aureococcus anophagefferens]|nr:hypothetical protein JL720_8985 [Aureococcus anophagefferens]
MKRKTFLLLALGVVAKAGSESGAVSAGGGSFDSACTDSTRWYKGKAKKQDCAWVGEKAAKRCKSKVKSKDGVKAKVACPVACGTCPTPADARRRPRDLRADARARGNDIDGEAAVDYSGSSVSLSADGTALAVGAPRNDGAGSYAGHARVFAWDSDDETWKQRGDDIDGEAADDWSGISVSLSADGTALAVGAIENDGAGSNAGHARRGEDIDGEAAYDQSGRSVSLSADGTALAVGALFNDGGPGSNAGHARVFAWHSDDETWVQRGDDIDGEAVGDCSGWSVSLSADGTALAVGARYNDGASSNAGHTRVFAWNSFDETWVQRGGDIDGEAAGDQSGYSVSLSADGTALAVGAPGNRSSRGHARVFAWNSDDETWVQRGDDIDGEKKFDQSGYSVSLSADGTMLAVGADDNDGAGSDAGHARVFAWDSDDETWKQRGDDVDGEAVGDRSGKSVSLSADGTALAVGAINNDGAGNSAGSTRVYTIAPSSTPAPTTPAPTTAVVAWIQRGDDIDGEAAGDQSGISVSLSADGTTLAVGARGNGGAGSSSGHTRVFAWHSDDETWVQRGDDIDGEAADDYSGTSVSLSADGTTLAVGAQERRRRRPLATLFAWNSDNNDWEKRGDDIDGEAAGDRSGYSVSLSADGTTLAVGAYGNDGSGNDAAGHARVFAWDADDETADGMTLAVGAYYNDGAGWDAGHTRVFAWHSDNNEWEKRGDDIDGEAAGDQSGISVSLSADGTALAIGAYLNDGAGSWAGSNVGHARVFAWDSDDETWKQRGDDIDGVAADDYSGYSVSLSADGTMLAVGAWGNDGSGTYAGHALVFAWDSDETWIQRGDDIDGEAARDYSGRSVSLSADGTALAVGARYNDGAGNGAHARI